MSKKISIREKRKWLDMFEEGKTEAHIAKEAEHDLRTIKKGIEEAAKERSLASAEAEMLRKALLDHQDQLKEILRHIIEMLVLPPHGLKLREESNGILAPVPLSGVIVQQPSKEQMILDIYNEEKLEWELLKEHLKQDKLWRYIKQWRDAMLDYMWAIWQFKLAIKAEVIKSADLISSDEANKKKLDTVRIAITDLFYEVAISRLLGIRNDTDIEKSIFSKMSELNADEQSIQKLSAVFDSLLRTEEAFKVKRTRSALADITKTAYRPAKEIELLNMVIGKCRVCRRLGR